MFKNSLETTTECEETTVLPLPQETLLPKHVFQISTEVSMQIHDLQTVITSFHVPTV